LSKEPNTPGEENTPSPIPTSEVTERPAEEPQEVIVRTLATWHTPEDEDVEPEEENCTRYLTPYIEVSINGHKYSALLDTGSEASLMTEEVWRNISSDVRNASLKPASDIVLVDFSGKLRVKATGRTTVLVELAGMEQTLDVLIVKRLNTSLILGVDFLQELRARVDFESMEFSAPCESTRIVTKLLSPSLTAEEASDFETPELQLQQVTVEDAVPMLEQKVQETNLSSAVEEHQLLEVLLRHRASREMPSV